MSADFNLVISIVFQLAFIAAGLYGCGRDPENRSFMSRDYSCFLKAFCCFSVILAHTGAGERYCLAGCLHWIAVCLFFLFSGYGLSYGAMYREGYLKTFYRRLLKSVIPLLLVLALKAACSCSLWSGGMNYMLVAILFYLVFFIVHSLLAGRKGAVLCGLGLADLLLVGFTLAYSLFTQYFHDARMAQPGFGEGLSYIPALFGWGCQSLGFAYGVVLAKKLDSFKSFLSRRRNAVLVLAVCLLLLHVLGYAYLGTRDLFYVSWTEYGLRAAMTLCLLLVAAVLSQGLRFGNSFIRLVGGISSEMFLLHGFVIEMLERCTGRCGDAGGLCRSWPGLFVVVVCLLTFAVAFLLHQLLKALYRLLRI